MLGRDKNVGKRTKNVGGKMLGRDKNVRKETKNREET